MKRKDMTSACPAEDRAVFLRENAVSVVEQRDQKIMRQKERITRLEKMVRSLRSQLRKSDSHDQ